MAVRQRSFDRDAVPAGGQHGAALEQGAQPFDDIAWPVAEVEQRALLDLAADPIALAQQDGGRRAAVGNGLDIHGLQYAYNPRIAT